MASTKKNNSANRILKLIEKENPHLSLALVAESDSKTPPNEIGTADRFDLKCKSNGCGYLVYKGLPYIQHLEQCHPLYRPAESTLKHFGCTRCAKCDNSIVPLKHTCKPYKSPKVIKSNKMPGKENYKNLIEVSWTVTATNEDIPRGVYTIVSNIIDQYFDVGIVSMERGTREKHLHCQCTGSLYFSDDVKIVKWLGSEFRKMMTGYGNYAIKSQFKKFEKKQTLRAMIGYCIKQINQPWHEMHKKGISDDEIMAAKSEYQFHSTDPSDGKITIVKKNLFKLCYAVYKEKYEPTLIGFVEILAHMLNSEYYLDPFFFMNQGLSLSKCQIFWNHLIGGKNHKLSNSSVERLIFLQRKGADVNSESERILYRLDEFSQTLTSKFVLENVKTKDNFMVIGPSNIGKTQLIIAALQYTNISFIMISCKEELKMVTKNHKSIIFDDFDFDSLTKSEIIRILDRDKNAVYIECKFDVAAIYCHQQIIVVGNFIDQKFNDEPIRNRILIHEVHEDLRNLEKLGHRTTSRGNHLFTSESVYHDTESSSSESDIDDTTVKECNNKYNKKAENDYYEAIKISQEEDIFDLEFEDNIRKRQAKSFNHYQDLTPIKRKKYEGIGKSFFIQEAIESDDSNGYSE